MSTEEDDKSVKSKEPNELKEIINRFLERSTLPVVGVMQQKISLFWRIVWICVVITGITFAIMQSIEVVDNYLSYPTFVTYTEEVNTSVFFPAITLCSQNLIDWKKVMETNHSIGHVIKKAAEEKRKKTGKYHAQLITLRSVTHLHHLVANRLQDASSTMEQHDRDSLKNPVAIGKANFRILKILKSPGDLNRTIFFDNLGENAISRRVRLEGLLMSELHRLNWDEKNEYLYTYDEWLKLCMIQDVTQDSVHCNNTSPYATVYSPYYGPCVTINTGLDKESMLSISTKSKMIIIAEFPRNMEFPYMARSNGLLVSIHAPGSAPVIPWSKYVEILPGEWLYATMDVFDVKRLPDPFASACLDAVSPEFTEFSSINPYQTNSTPYAYTREECMSTCFSWAIHENYKCINPFAAMNEKMEFFKKAELCGSNTIDPNFLELVEDECTKFCRKPCREFIYVWAPMTLNIPKHTGYLYDILDVSSEKANINTEEMVYVTLKMQSTVYVIGEETAKYEIEDVFGAIGGNLGLWIGVSILTIFEVFELITSLVVYFMKKLFFLCFKKK